MDIKNPMSLLLIEDDVADCILYKNCVQNRDDVRFVGMTGSSIEGIKYVKNHLPEGVILDIELHKGKGSGIDFLAELKELSLDFRPLVVVVTNISSNTVYNHLHESGADLVFYKKQADYSAEMVIKSLLSLRKSLHYTNKAGIAKDKDVTSVETPEERRIRISEKLNLEFNLIGISSHLKGRNYLYDAILYLLQEDNNESVFEYLTNVYKRSNSSISRAMQTSINNAWRMSQIDDLQIHYTARVNHETGVPTPTQFVYYYADKLRKFI